MSIGKKIKVLRAERGMSQLDLADRINKTRPLISHIEVTSKVNYFTLVEIANALDVNVSYFTDDFAVVKEDEAEYLSLPDQLKKVERENELLSEIIENQKEIIAQLKERLKQKE